MTNETVQPKWVARATRLCRPATRRTERGLRPLLKNADFSHATVLTFRSACRPCYPWRWRAVLLRMFAAKCVLLLALACPRICRAADQAQPATNSFPSLYDVLQGRIFPSDFERDVFFLRGIHDRYSSQWPGLLQANITVDEYLHSSGKLLRFINVLGNAMAGSDDPVAITNLVAITGDPVFYANTNGYFPEIQRAAAKVLIQLGQNGRKALASCLGQAHYRGDTESLEDLMSVIGNERPDDPVFTQSLAAVAFDFSTPGGGIFPGCTAAAVTNLLRLPDGAAAARSRLKIESVFDNPGRFQAVIDGIAAARTTELITNLAAIEAQVKARLVTLTNTPGAYRDDLQDLENRLRKTIGEFGKVDQVAK